MKKIYIIAGEPSGDFLGASIIGALKKKRNDLMISGVGGILMEKEGLESLFDIEQTSIGGITEVIPHILKIKNLVAKTVDDIVSKSPDVVLTIDSPGFCFWVARLLRKRNKDIKLMHFVAPNVWAWRPKRAKKIAKFYDHILTLFDFEPEYFEKEGLKATFVGHPAIETFPFSDIKNSDKVLIMPGSRPQEIKSLLPIFIESAKLLGESNIIIPTLPHLIPLMRSISKEIPIETDESKKIKLYQSAKLAIVASGTATLQLALCGCPMVVCYKISNISFQIIKRLVKIKYISLVNIISNKFIVPELIQNECNAEKISDTIKKIDTSDQTEKFKELRKKLTNNNQNPSEKIADILI